MMARWSGAIRSIRVKRHPPPFRIDHRIRHDNRIYPVRLQRLLFEIMSITCVLKTTSLPLGLR